MHTSSQLLIILTTISLCALLANRLSVAAPLAFLLGGVALALVPGMGSIAIDPEYMLVLFLPPILMEAAFFTSIRDFRASLTPILRLAIGLVVISAVAVAFTLQAWIPGATLALGMVLGAIIAPPDAAAATAALKHTSLPKRITTILEGESLVNDATGIVLYNFAVATVMAGHFSALDAGIDFLWKSAGGVAVGYGIGFVFVKIYPLFRDHSANIIATFVPPYAAYVLAEHAGSSGVLAVVTSGLLVGWHAPSLISSLDRLPMNSIWNMTVYFLSALAFLLIGLQLPAIVLRLEHYDMRMVATMTLAVCLATVLVRFAYVYIGSYAYYAVRRCRAYHKLPAWQNVFIVGWTSMRGVVTLALALALPMTLPDGSAFPHRDLLIFISLMTILFTLVLQSLTLPWMTRHLRLRYDDSRLHEEWLARVNATRTALGVLAQINEEGGGNLPAMARIRQHYEERLDALGDGPNTPLTPNNHRSLLHQPQLLAENHLWLEALRSERDTVINLRHQFAIGDDVMNDILREVDLLSARYHYEIEKIPEPEQRRRWRRIIPRRATA
jgi:Na+/H+ antiporter